MLPLDTVTILNTLNHVKARRAARGAAAPSVCTFSPA
jgi:hypothetical protein